MKVKKIIESLRNTPGKGCTYYLDLTTMLVDLRLCKMCIANIE